MLLRRELVADSDGIVGDFVEKKSHRICTRMRHQCRSHSYLRISCVPKPKRFTVWYTFSHIRRRHVDSKREKMHNMSEIPLYDMATIKLRYQKGTTNMQTTLQAYKPGEICTSTRTF